MKPGKVLLFGLLGLIAAQAIAYWQQSAVAELGHGGQEFEWGEPACSGDEITTTAKCLEIYEKDGKGFYVFETNSVNQDGAQVVRGTWTNIVRGV